MQPFDAKRAAKTIRDPLLLRLLFDLGLRCGWLGLHACCRGERNIAACLDNVLAGIG